MIHLIKAIKGVEPFKITLEFNTGEVLTVDLKQKIELWSTSEGSRFRDLTDPKRFREVKLNCELESVYWDNGIDLCPDVLYQLGREQLANKGVKVNR